jgi:hypothetical protein
MMGGTRGVDNKRWSAQLPLYFIVTATPFIKQQCTGCSLQVAFCYYLHTDVEMA